MVLKAANGKALMVSVSLWNTNVKLLLTEITDHNNNTATTTTIKATT